MAQPFLPNSAWVCLANPAGWAQYGPYGSSTSIPGSGAHVIDADGYDRIDPGYSPTGFAGWPRGDFFQVPPCAAAMAGGPVAPVPTAVGAAPGPTGALSTGPSCGCRAPVSTVVSTAAPPTGGILPTTQPPPTPTIEVKKLPWWVWVLALVAGSQLFNERAT